jgi:cytoskeletal protein CcmA (bactofilin family)
LTFPKRKQWKKFLGRLFAKEEQGIGLIGEGVSVVGTLNFGEGVVHLDGRLEGKIIGRGTLIIGEKGMLHGEVNVTMLILGGWLEGTVTAPGGAHITPTGKLFGKVQASQLVIEEGGVFEGESKSIKKAESLAPLP